MLCEYIEKRFQKSPARGLDTLAHCYGSWLIKILRSGGCLQQSLCMHVPSRLVARNHKINIQMTQELHFKNFMIHKQCNKHVLVSSVSCLYSVVSCSTELSQSPETWIERLSALEQTLILQECVDLKLSSCLERKMHHFNQTSQMWLPLLSYQQSRNTGQRDNLLCPERNSPAIIVSQVGSLFLFHSHSVTIE